MTSFFSIMNKTNMGFTIPRTSTKNFILTSFVKKNLITTYKMRVFCPLNDTMNFSYGSSNVPNIAMALSPSTNTTPMVVK